MTDSQYYPETPQELKDAQDVENSQITASLPAVQDLYDWLTKTIDECDHLSALGEVTSDTPAEHVKARLILSAEWKQKLESKRAEFKSTFAQYISEDSE